MLTEVGELEKLGTPVAVDEVASTSAPVNSVQQPATNIHGQGQQQVQQPRPSQYTCVSCLTNNSGNITVYPIEGLSPYQNKYDSLEV